MSRLLQVEIQESAEKLKELMNEQSRTKFRERLQVLYWLKAGLCDSLQSLADHLGRSKSVVFKWLKIYRTEGLNGLLQWNYHGGRPTKISEVIRSAILDRLNNPTLGFRSYKEIQRWIFAEYQLDIPYSTVHQMVRYQWKAKLKVARPMSLHRDDEAVVSFKKNWPKRSK